MGGIYRNVGGQWRGTVGIARLSGTQNQPPTDPPPFDPLAAAADPAAVAPYTMPSGSPYNAPVAATTPTYDGSGETVHPSVLDFQQINGGTWHGWRYWMAHSPYQNANDLLENPSILVSQNGYYWRKPDGVRDPVYAAPATGFSSDPDLIYDPDADQLVLLHRTTLDDVNHTIYITRSSDGSTWPTNPTTATLTQNGQALSPALVRVAAGDWRLFALSKDTRNMQMWKATTADGPWTGPYETAGASRSDGFWGWHLEVRYIAGVFYALVDRGPLYLGQPDGYRASTSLDGMSWTQAAADFMTKTASGWDSLQLYRATFAPHENGTHFRVWYSASEQGTGVEKWHAGLTVVPRTAWPTPAAAPTAGVQTGYGQAVTPDAPALWWRMEGDPLTSTTETDASGNGRTGAYTGGHVRASSLSGDVAYATRLWNGALYRAREAWMDATTFTAEAVVKPTVTAGVWPVLSLYGPTWGWSLRGNNSSLQLAHSNGTVVSFFGAFSAGQTKHVAVTVAAGTATLLINGAVVTSGAIDMGTPTTDTRLAAGAQWAGTNWGAYLTGELDEVAYYPGVTLSTARLLAHAQAAGLA